MTDNAACDVYNELSSHLPTEYTPRSFSYDFNFQSLNGIIDIYGAFVNAIFQGKLFEYIDTIYNAFKAGTPPIGSILGLLNIQIGFFVVLGILILLLVVAIVAIVLKLLCGGNGESYQKISPWLGTTRFVYGVFLFLLTIFISFIIIIGLVGIMHWQQTKVRYETFARNATEFFEEYAGNITQDMGNMASHQFDYMLNVLEQDIYEYQELAAETVREIEEPYAKQYFITADKMEAQEVSINAGYDAIEPLLNDIISLAKVYASTTTSCYTGVRDFCANGDEMCDELFSAVNAEPIFDYTTEWITKDNFKTSVDDYDIPTITKENWEMWNETIDDLMEYNKPLRDRQKMHHENFQSWMGKNIELMNLIRRSWVKLLDSSLPENDRIYMSKATSGVQTQVIIVRWVLASLQISAFVGSILCITLIAVGLCVADPKVLPTERSSLSTNIASCLKLVSMFFSVLLVLVLAVTIPFFIISSLVSQTCTETDSGKNPFWLWDNKTLTDTSPISKAIGIEGKDISFKDFLDDCKDNKPMYQVFSLEDTWDIKNKFILGDFLDFLRVVEQSDLNPHKFWYSDFYGKAQRSKLENVLDLTSNNYTGINGVAPEEVVPYAIIPRGLIRVPVVQLPEFKDKATAARNKYSSVSSIWRNLNSCITNINNQNWVDLHTKVWEQFRLYRDKASEYTMVESLVEYRTHIETLNDVEVGESMFANSKSTYKRKMMESLVVLEAHVKCYEDLAMYQYEVLLGRCRPLYDIYNATKSFICHATAPTAAIETFTLLLLTVSLVIYSVVLSLSVPFFQKMSRLHPEDEKQFERERIAKIKPSDTEL